VSDDAVVKRFLENPYWQYFCAFEFFQHEFPLDPITLDRPQGMEKLLQVTIETAKSKEYVTEKHLERVNVDTTFQKKVVAFPTDASLYHKASLILVRLAKRNVIDLRQTYERLGKRAFIMKGCYSHARRRTAPSVDRDYFASTLAE
jgi:IS5 family transposase